METELDKIGPGLALKSKLAVELVANKWRLMIVYALAPGTLRYGQLQQVIGRISHKALTQTLRGLERDGIVERKTYPVVPPRVEYSLTHIGASLVEPLRLLCEWAQENESSIVAAQARFDESERSWALPVEPEQALRNSSPDSTPESNRR